MDYLSVLQDSIDTSIEIKIFKTREEASIAHIFHSKLVKLHISIFNNIDNFDSNRLQKSVEKAYPVNNRPRGEDDVSSVTYYKTQLQQKNEIIPIFMINKNNKYILLDGSHRIVASYIEEKEQINAYVIHIE
jgi:hypothetical protein